MVMTKRLTLALLPGLLASAGAVQDPDNLPETYCVTYLSTYLATISSNTTSSVPTDVEEHSSQSADALSTELTQSDSASEPTTNIFTDSQSTTSRTEPSTTTGPTEPGTAGRSVIFRIVPDTRDSKRGPLKRALGGLVGSSQEDCNEASTFRLSEGRLLDGTAPVFNDGENFKELRGRAGSLPSAVVTTTFAEENGFLRLRNATLPNGEAGFCQTPSDGRVYLTFTSSPPDCVTVRLSVIEAKECEGKAASSEPIQPPTQRVTTSYSLTSSSDVTSAINFPTLQPSSDEAIQPNPIQTSSFRFTNTSSSLLFPEAPTASSDDFSSTINRPATDFITTIPASSISLPPLFPTLDTTEIDQSTTFDSFPTDTLSAQSLGSSESVPSSIMAASDSTSLDPEATTVEPTISASETASVDSEVTSTAMTESMSTATLESTSLAPTSETTTAETTTTTAVPTRVCESYLVNPTTLFSGDGTWEDESRAINLPFPVGIYTESSDTLFVGVNGLLSLFDADLTASENTELPVGSLPDVTIAAYWDNLRIPQNAGYEITYLVYDNEDGGGYRAVNIDWCVVDSNDVVTHFMVILQAYDVDNPASAFMRYFASNGGGSATIGVQDLVVEKSLQYSSNEGGNVPDGCTVLFFTIGGDERVVFVPP